MAYPDKYAEQQAKTVDLTDHDVIRVEDLLSAKTVLTYNDAILATSKKDLVAAFTAGLIIGGTDSEE